MNVLYTIKVKIPQCKFSFDTHIGFSLKIKCTIEPRMVIITYFWYPTTVLV